MTNSDRTPPVLPTAAEALREAVECARNGNTDRGELWLGIAVELRTDAQYRSVNERLFPKIDNTKAFPPAATDHAGETAGDRVGRLISETFKYDPSSYGDLAQRGPAPVITNEEIGQQIAEATQYMPVLGEPDFATQVIPIVWSVGDKADCAHCHTPIVLCFRETEQQTYGEGGDEVVWLHKYTDLAVCQNPVIAEGDAEEAVHTYAEPAHRG